MLIFWRKNALAFLLGMFCACYSFAQQPVEVMGQLKKQRPSVVKLFRVMEGDVVEMARSIPTQDGRFGFLFYPPYEGFYVIGTGDELAPDNNYKFYFKGGEKLSVLLTDTSYALTGKSNSKENILLTRWHDFAYPLEKKSRYYASTYKDFFPDLESIASATKGFLKGKSSGNPTFDRMMPDNMSWDLAGYASSFLQTPRSIHPKPEEYSDYYNGMKLVEMGTHTEAVYRQPWGKRVLQQVASVNLRHQKIQYTNWQQSLEDELKLLHNDTLKGDFVLYKGSMVRSITDYQWLLDRYGKYLLTENQQQQSRLLQTPLASLKEGEPGLNFRFPDQDGKMISMSDLKGKILLVDLWATWCAPCRAQFPGLKQLEEDFKNTDLQVVSISIDSEKDREKWKEMIRKENLGGIQLFANKPDDMRKYYKVESIPRFMVFDREGRIITVNAPRPSDPALKELLKKSLDSK